ncbi:MAG TPA: phospho-N-acetylmuramoyl-pentapeptide-transferase [Pirellulales bacterium]|jgi:phospho-N-acetylmuramoyl-pentapeptide-transferase|nr:phospho-N-acetylmuramoyl-pentapeptide-transferase [Pirellulales bacterium]
MLVWLLDRLAANWPATGEIGQIAALSKTTPRACLAACASFLLALCLGRRVIAWLRARFREPIKSDSETLRQLHHAKQATPTMGGLFLVAGLLAGLTVFADLANRYVQVAILLAIGLTIVGALDDLTKLRSASKGLSVKAKLFGQTSVALAAAWLVYREHLHSPAALDMALPGFGSFSLGAAFVPLAVLVIVGSSNAVNLADGLDGLAGGCLAFATGGLALMVYAGGHAGLAEYLGVARISHASEMLIVAAGMLGGILGFLWFNCHPAQVFMGDTGSLPLGGLLGLLAVVARQEILLLVVGGVFVAEALSVMLQVAGYRLTGKRIFRCAPLHHHFEFQGWPETQIVVRFWIASALCAMLGLIALRFVPETGDARSAGRETALSQSERRLSAAYVGAGRR